MISLRKICSIAGTFLIISVKTSLAQEADELIRQWSGFRIHDTAYINLSNKIAEQLNFNGFPDSALLFSDSALQVSGRLHFSLGEAKAKCVKGKINIAESNFAKALDYIGEAHLLFDSISYTAGIADCILQTGIIYYNQREYSHALSYFSSADSAYNRVQDIKHSSVCRYLGALCLMELKDFSKAEMQLKEVENTDEDLGDNQAKYESHWALANLYLRIGQFEKSKEYYVECLKFFIIDKNSYGIAMMHSGIGDVYLKEGKRDSAEKYFLLALAEGTAINYLQVITKDAQSLASLYSQLGNFKKAFEYQSMFYSTKDSLYNQETKQKIGYMEAAFNLSTKNSQIDSLKRKRRNDKNIFYLLISSIVLLIILVTMAFQRFRFKQQTNKILERKNKDLADAMSGLKSAQIQLVHNEKMASLGQLTAGIAHEINNPINFVTSSVNPLKRNFADVKELLESYEQLLSKTDQRFSTEQLKKEFDLQQTLAETEKLLFGIEEGSRRTAEIVKGLRNFSRLDSEEKKSVNINAGIESTLTLLQNKLTHQNIEVIKSLGSISGVGGYPGQLNQVFMNFLTNAIDAIGEKGEIFITTGKENNFVKISFRDTGTGMTDEVKQKIFDPFFTTKEVGKGTGLGLSISYGIIERHNGKIEVQSELGKGSEFTVYLPA